jgi:4a-hydroxytetrahydrobiopterin dehydratase
MTQACPLAQRKCIPCEGGVPPLSEARSRALLAELGEGWALEEGKLARSFKFRNFVEAIAFVNRLAEIAEAEGHHPGITINYNRVRLQLFTHAIKGLSENDFILAAKISQLPR